MHRARDGRAQAQLAAHAQATQGQRATRSREETGTLGHLRTQLAHLHPRIARTVAGGAVGREVRDVRVARDHDRRGNVVAEAAPPVDHVTARGGRGLVELDGVNRPVVAVAYLARHQGEGARPSFRS